VLYPGKKIASIWIS